MTPNQQASRIVDEFETFIARMGHPGHFDDLHHDWVAGAQLFANQMLINLLGCEKSYTYRSQLDTIRDRVLPPAEMQK